jgi:DNA-binding transcriptional regulator YbjK
MPWSEAPQIYLDKCPGTIRQVGAPETVTDQRRQRGAARRRQILTAALRVIARDGIGDATHRTIATEAGVPTSVTTYHFASINDLLKDALRLFVEEEIARVRAVTVAIQGPGFEHDRAAVVAGVLEAVGDPTLALAQFELYLEARRRPALADEAKACMEAYLELAAAVLGRLGATKPREGANAVVALLDGLTMQRLVAPRDDFDTAVAAPALMAIIEALGPAATVTQRPPAPCGPKYPPRGLQADDDG